MATLSNIIYLTKAQYTTLKNGGSITVGSQTYTYDANADYRIPLTASDYLVAGTNVQISGNTISATDTKDYTLLTNIPTLDGTSITGALTKAGLGIQAQVVAGDGITLGSDNKTISAKVDESTITVDSSSKKIKGNYQAGSNISISGNTIATTGLYTSSEVDTKLADKQDKLTAGTNITIAADGKTISATDTKYTAGTNISVSADNKISTTNVYNKTEVNDAISAVTLTGSENISITDKVVNITDKVYTKAQTDGAIATAIAGVTQFNYSVVTELPTTGVKGTIYLKANTSSGQNIYDEYIWIQVGEEAGKYEVIGSTAVDISSKVDKVTTEAGITEAYVHTGTTQTVIKVDQAQSANSIVQRTSGQQIVTAETPTADGHVTSKKYVDTQVATKQNTLTAGTNIDITDNTISATDTTYTAKSGSAITLSGTEFDLDATKISYASLTNKPAIEGTTLTKDTKVTDVLKSSNAAISVASGTGDNAGKGVVTLNYNTDELEISSDKLQVKNVSYSKVTDKPTVNGATITGAMTTSAFVTPGNGLALSTTDNKTLSAKVKADNDDFINALTNSSDGLAVDQSKIYYTNISDKPTLDGTSITGTLTKSGLGIQAQVVAGDGIALANDNKTLSASVDNSTVVIDGTSKKIKGNYQAGTNITITGNTIAATDTTYTAGSNITISGDNNTIATTGIYTKTEVDSLISGVTQFDYEVVTTLPTTGVKGKIYLLSNSGSGQNIYTEYIWVKPTDAAGYYEQLGTTAVDISGKVDKVTTAGANEVYVHQGATQTAIAYTTDATANTVAYRGANGVLSVGTPTANSNATTKSYVDTADAAKVDKISTTSTNGLVYGVSNAGAQTSYAIDATNGIASKSYVDTGLAAKQAVVNIIRLDA